MSVLGQNFILHFVAGLITSWSLPDMEHRLQEIYFWKTILPLGEYFLAIYVIND